MSQIAAATARLRQELLQRDAEAAKALLQAYGQTYGVIATRLQQLFSQMQAAKARGETLSPAWLLQEKRLTTLQAQAREAMNQYAAFAEARVVAAQRTAVLKAGEDARTLTMAGLLDAGQSGMAVRSNWNRLPDEALTDLVGALQDGSPLRALFDTFGQQASEGMRHALITGLATGLGTNEIARQIRQTLDIGRTRAQSIARTETLRAYRSATLRTYQANGELLEGWQWIASLGGRTCASCLAMHGTKHPLDAPFGSHTNCRCTMVPIVLNSDSEVESGEQWLESEPLETQEKVFGVKGAAAYREGQVKLEDFVKVTESERWGTTRSTRSLPEALRAAELRRSKEVPLPEWKPTMTRSEADAWAKNSTYNDPLYHITPLLNRDSLLQGGFDLTRNNYGRVWGDGVYMATDSETANLYRRWIEQGGRTTTRLELRVNVQKVFRFDASTEVNTRDKKGAVAALLPGGTARYTELVAKREAANEALFLRSELLPVSQRVAFLKAEGYSYNTEAAALSQMLAEAGYDALLVQDTVGLSTSVGGNQMMVVDPKKVVIVRD